MKHRHLSTLFIGLLTITLSILSVIHVEAAKDCHSGSFGYGYSNCEVVTSFNDTAEHTYNKAILYAQEREIVKGYDDGTFKPDNPVNRAEFTKIIVEALIGRNPTEFADTCFPDIEKDIWFSSYVCYAKEEGLIKGYPDGTFQPVNNINFVEVSKILTVAFRINHRDAEDGEDWFTPFVVALSDHHFIPGTVRVLWQPITRGEMAELIMRFKEEISTLPSLNACDFIPILCPGNALEGYGDRFIGNVDMKTVRQTWLDWYNTERRKLGLHDYVYNRELNRTAYLWSQEMADRNETNHKRVGQTEYYDYNMISDWFKNIGVEFENINTVTFTENIGWGPFVCEGSNCTLQLLDAIKSTFDMYMGEKDKEDRSHYNSVMNKYFNEVGLGIVLKNKKYYLTVHYGTRLQ